MREARTPPPANDADATANRIAVVVRERFTGTVSATLDMEGRARLVGAVSDRWGGGRRRVGLRPALLAGALVSATAVAALLFAPGAALTYTTEGLQSDGASGDEGAPALVSTARLGVLQFSDGSRVALEPKSRARVARTRWRGADVELASGRAEVDVVHRRLTRWSVQAGPYRIHVTGTSFAVDWAPDTKRLEVKMRSGSVRVEGPLSRGDVALQSDERLLVDASGAALIGRASPDEARPPSIVAAPVVAPVPAEVAQPIARDEEADDERGVAAPEEPAAVHEPKPRPRTSAPAPASWAERVARGEFAVVMAEARGRGLQRVLEGASLADLSALADAGRYLGDYAVAERALEAERRRFAGSPPATMAAFLLGRIADDRGDPPARSIAWYERYLAEAPRGTFAAEAMGRRLLAEQRRSADPERIRALAREYLERFPRGPYAEVARTLSQGR